MASAIELLTIEIAEYHWAASTMAGGSRPGRGTKRPCPRLSNLNTSKFPSYELGYSRKRVKAPFTLTSLGSPADFLSSKTKSILETVETVPVEYGGHRRSRGASAS